jgi:hypothetical protein
MVSADTSKAVTGEKSVTPPRGSVSAACLAAA